MPPALQSSSKSIAGSRSLMYKRPTAVRLFFSIVGSLVAIFGGLWLFVTHSFLFWIVLVLAVMIGWAIHKNKLMEQTRSRLQSKYRFDDLYVSTDDRSFVGVIFVSDQLVVGKAELDSAYPFAQITAVEVIENGVTITRTNRGSQILGGAVGALVFGGVGAIVGGLSGSTQSTSNIRSISLKVTIDDRRDPVYSISFLNSSGKGTDPNSFIARQARAKADRFHAHVLNAMRQVHTQARFVVQSGVRTELTNVGFNSDDLQQQLELKGTDTFTAGDLQRHKTLPLKESSLEPISFDDCRGTDIAAPRKVSSSNERASSVVEDSATVAPAPVYRASTTRMKHDSFAGTTFLWFIALSMMATIIAIIIGKSTTNFVAGAIGIGFGLDAIAAALCAAHVLRTLWKRDGVPVDKKGLAIGIASFLIVISVFDGAVVRTCLLYERSESERGVTQATAPSGEHQAGQPPNKVRTQTDFEDSEFCRRYNCKESNHWELRNGEMNYSYKTSLHNVSPEIQTNAASIVTGIGLGFYERMRLSGEDFDVISTLTRSIDHTGKHNKTMSFIEDHVETKVCDTCSVMNSGQYATDGDFRIRAGKAMNEVVSFQRLSTYRQPSTLKSLGVGTSVVRVGDLADDIVPIMATHEVLHPLDEKVSGKPTLSAVRRFYRINGNAYSLEFRRRGDSGAYTVFSIRDEGTQ